VFDHPESFGTILAPEANEWEGEPGWIAPGGEADAPGFPAQNPAPSAGADADPTILCW
jgi:hypothetical protein